MMFYALCLFAGLLLSVQPAVNNLLGRSLQSASMGAFLNFMIGGVALALVVLATGNWRWPGLQHLQGSPWWYWTGGLMGAMFVMVAILAFPRVGASMTLILFLIGQMFSSALMDHFGWLGLDQKPLGLAQIGGLILVAAGMFLFNAR